MYQCEYPHMRILASRTCYVHTTSPFSEHDTIAPRQILGCLVSDGPDSDAIFAKLASGHLLGSLQPTITFRSCRSCSSAVMVRVGASVAYDTSRAVISAGDCSCEL